MRATSGTRRTNLAEPDDDLTRLTRLAELWDEIESLVRNCRAVSAVTMEDEHRFADLMKEAQVLVGRLSHRMNRTFVELYGRRWDAMETLLGTTSISSLFSPERIADVWFMSLSGARSQTRQALGRVEAEEQSRSVKLSPDVIIRWQQVIGFFEGLRRCIVNRPAMLDPWLTRIEGSRGYRIAAIISTFGGFAASVVLVVGIVAALVVLLVR